MKRLEKNLENSHLISKYNSSYISGEYHSWYIVLSMYAILGVVCPPLNESKFFPADGICHGFKN